MMTLVKRGAAAGAVALAISALALAQAPPPDNKVTTDKDGVIHIADGVMPPSSILSEAGKAVLAQPREGRGPAPAAPSVSMAERRAKMDADLQPRVAHMRELYPVDIQETTIDGVSVAIVTPKGGVPERNKNRIMLNVPGGGFSTGIRANGLFFSIPAASLGQVKVVTALYRQGPEARFPAATEDFMKVYTWALKDHKPTAIGMFGCSAGGVLVAETIAAALQSGMPAPGAAGIYCAGASARFDGDSNNVGQLLSNGGSANTRNVIASGPGQYFDGIDTTQAAASPVNDLALLAKFPPTILATGTRDFAMSQAAFAHRQLLKVGVDTDLLIYDGLGHGFMTNPDIPESRDFYELTVKFFEKHLAR
ncbi:MAG: alpha/beta hydrolase fold domain-containing protein [Acidobacteria bacterium]|nr:alpha/beta hydrolase fold domain-containing protein [Acidobacteriota bacterium]